MSTREIIKRLCAEKGISVQKLELDLGFSNGSIQKSADNMKVNRLIQIAQYFGVTVEYLIGSEKIQNDPETHTWEYVESAKDNQQEQQEYYIDPATAKLTEFLHKNPEYAILFDATTRVKPKDIKLALRAIGLFIEEENDD